MGGFLAWMRLDCLTILLPLLAGVTFLQTLLSSVEAIPFLSDALGEAVVFISTSMETMVVWSHSTFHIDIPHE